MKSPEVSFHSYLLREVSTAGEHYERAKEKVLQQTAGPELCVGPALLEATEALSDAMQLYINALRRLAHFAVHQARTSTQKEMAAAAGR